MVTRRNNKRLSEIENRLNEAFKPFYLKVIDDSEKHAGHTGAQSGAGHFSVKIISQAFEGKKLAERHRMIYTALADMMNTEIHALQIDAKPIPLDDMIQFVTDALSNHKARDIKVLDVSSLTDVMDSMVICTATSSRHAASLAGKLVEAVKKVGVRPYNTVQDQTETGWILVDLLDIVVHIMLAETREFYHLEKLWSMTETSRNSKNE